MSDSSQEDQQMARDWQLFQVIHEKIPEGQKIKKLIDCLKDGANVSALNSKGKSILDIAIKKHYKRIIRFLQKPMDGDVNTSGKDDSSQSKDHPRFNNDEGIVATSKSVNNEIKNESAIDDNSKDFLDRLEIIREGMSQHGVLFQLKLLMLVLWRATANQFSQFRLATEFPEGEKFDDVVLQYRKETSAKWKCRLLQAKHKENSEDKLSTKLKKIEGLFGCDDKAFSLQKYFRSYLKIKQKTVTPSPYSIFFQNEIEDVVIITNTDFNVSDRKYFEKVDLDLQTDEIFRLEDKENKFKNATVYKPSMKSGILEKCIPIFESTSDYYTLIEILVELIVKGEINRKNENLLKEYYYPLTKSLLQIEEDCKKSSAKLRWKKDCPFIDSLVEEIAFVTLFDGKKIKMSADIRNKMFVDNLKESVKNSAETVQTLKKLAENVSDAVKNEQELDGSLVTKFQKFIQEFLDVNNETLHSNFVHGNLKGNKMSDEMKLFRRTFIKHLLTEEQKQETKRKFEGKELNISGKFVPVDQPIIQEVSEFAEQMRKLIVQNRETKTIKINKETPQFIRENLQMLSGFLIAEKFGKIRFCSTFLASVELSKSLREFKEEFSTLLGQEFEEIYRYEFQMKGCDFKTCMDGALETELPVLHHSDDVIEFFGKLKFIVNYPNRVEIDDLMERNIREKFKIVDGKAYNSLYVEGMHNWMANSIGTFFMPDQANEMFKNISNNLSIWTVDGITKVYLADVPKEFQFRDSNDFVEFLRNEKRVLIISTQNLQLTRIRIVQTFLTLQQKDLREFMKYTRGFGHIFLNLKQIVNEDFRTYVLNQIESSKELNLVVIECKEGEKNSELCDQFFGLINTKKKIKIVLIVPDKNLIVNLPNQFKQECIDISNFEGLDDRSKLKFLSQKITFQGQQTTFNDILGNDKTGNAICPDILCRTIEKKDVSIDSTPPLSKGYHEVYYVERNIGTKVYVDLGILKDEENDTVVVDEYEEKFVEKCKKFPGKNVHWFKQEQIKLSSTTSAVLKWQETKGSISNVLEYRINDNELTKESVEECDIINDKNDIVIISDLAGMGKSTLLSSLTRKVKIRFPDHWLFRIDLNDCTTVLSEELKINKFNRNDLDWSQDLLKKMLVCSPYTKLNTEQEEKLFLHSLSLTKKIFLLLDAVDEISPNYTNIIIEFILALRDFKLEKILITTRPNVAKKLEKELNVFSYTLETFSEHDQTTFLTKFWKKNILENNENIDDRLNLYAKSLITKMSTLIDDEQRSFTGIPLQLMMMAEIFQNADHEQEFESCFQFLMSKVTEPKLPEKLNIYDLYTMFIKKKYRIYSDEKKKDFLSNLGVEEDNEMLHKMYQEYHRTLALYAFFENDDLKILFDSFEYEAYMKKTEYFIECIDHGKERRGIIDQAINNKPTFIHRTFMEYFVAEFIVDEILNHGNNEKRAESMIRSIFNNDECTVIRSFINNLFLKKRLVECEFYGSVIDSIWQKEGSEGVDILKTACFENNQEIVRFILSSLKNYSSCKTDLFSNLNLKCLAKNLTMLKMLVENDFDLCTADKYEMWTILHHACDEYSLDIIQWLLNQNCIDVNLRDSHDSTPLHIIMNNVAENSLEILKILLDHGADVNACDKSRIQPLHEAAFQGKINEAKYLLEHGADVNCTTLKYWTLLHCAAKCERIEFCKWLINDHKIEINPRTNDGETPLYFAVEAKQVEIVKLLFEHGADVNACNKSGFQPLHEAASKGRIEIAKYLLELGVNINCMSCDGWTLLHCAASSGQIDFCKWLLNDHKVQVNSKTTDGTTPLQLSVKEKQIETTKLLLEHGADINVCDKNGSQPLHEAASQGKIDLAKYLLKHGADVNSVSCNGSTPLHCAARLGRLEFCKWLLNDYNVQVNSKTTDGTTPFHLAVKEKRIETTKLLLEHGADVNVCDKNGSQPLHETASQGRINEAKYLLEHGADVNCVSYNGSTLLHCAARSGRIKFCKWLLNDHKIEINPRTNDGETPLYFAVKAKQVEIVKLLFEHGADVNSCDKSGFQPLHEAASKGRIDIAKYLLEHGVNINCMSCDGWTLLHCAVNSEQIEFCKWLLNDHNVQVNSKTTDGTTPLHLAVKEIRIQTTKLLLEHGADVNVCDKNGSQPLHEAASHGRIYEAKYLIEHGADVNCVSYNGSTLLHCAARSGRIQFCKWLLNDHNVQVNSKTTDGTTPLHLAVKEKRIETTKLLLEQGADVNVCDENGSQPLHEVASIIEAKYLIEHGADVNCVSYNGSTLLHYAAKSGRIEFCKWLINDHKVDVNSKTTDGTTPLHLAVKERLIKTTKLLLEHGADVNVCDQNGSQPLHEVASQGRINEAKYLIEHGADVNCVSFDDWTLFHCAAKSGRIEFCEWLLNDHKAEVNPKTTNGKTPLHLAVESGKTEITKTLLEHGGKMYSFRDYYVEFILKSCPQLFSPLTFENFGCMLNIEEINWDGTIDLIEYLKSAAETLRNKVVGIPN